MTKETELRDEMFEKWFEEYFCNQQGEDSPYGYNDIKIGFLKGYKEGFISGKSEGIKKAIEEEIEFLKYLYENIDIDYEGDKTGNSIKDKIEELTKRLNEEITK